MSKAQATQSLISMQRWRVGVEVANNLQCIMATELTPLQCCVKIIRSEKTGHHAGQSPVRQASLSEILLDFMGIDSLLITSQPPREPRVRKRMTASPTHVSDKLKPD